MLNWELQKISTCVEIFYQELVERAFNYNHSHIPNRLAQFGLRTTLRIIAGALQGLRAIAKIFKFILWPIRLLGSLFYFSILRPLYRVYRLVRSLFNKILAPARNRWLYLLLHRNTIAGVVTVASILVALNNVQAQASTDINTFGQKSIFSTIFTNPQDEDTEIVEGPVVAAQKETPVALAPNTDQQARPADTTNTNSTNSEQQVALGTDNTGGSEESESIRYYIVEGGDTVSSIAAHFEISSDTIITGNQLGSEAMIKPGQKLIILPIDGVAHTVKAGETIASIAKKYKASEDKILEFNRLASAEALNTGEELIIPGGTVDQPAAPRSVPDGSSTPTRSFAGIKIPPSARVSRGSRLQWPAASHRVNQYFKWRHTGIDVDGDVGNPIYAADSGVVESVIYARYGYGYHVVINHGSGKETLYGHASKIFVRPGQSVKRGQTIALIGLTGRTTGAHLHFEVRINGGFRNPLSYL